MGLWQPRRHRHQNPNRRPLSSVVLRAGRVVRFGVRTASSALWIRVIRGVGVITGPATRQRSLGTKPRAPASGRIVVQVIPTVQETMARVQMVLISGIRSKAVCFTLNPIHRRACGLLIAGALVLLLIVEWCVFPHPCYRYLMPLLVKEISNSSPRLGEQPRALSRAGFHSSDLLFWQSDFYRTIIDNNLFRPLGWTPPRPIEPYRLLGTKLARDANTPPQAIVQAVTTNMTHIVTLGSNLDVDTQVVDIQTKQVTLSTQEQQRILIPPIGF